MNPRYALHLCALALACLPAHATDYHVDAAAGSDLNGAGTLASPWLTITHALGQVQGEGHTLHVAAGNYDAALGERFPLVMKPRVSIVGAGAASSRVIGSGSELLFSFDSSPSGGTDLAFGSDTRLERLGLAQAGTGVYCHSLSSSAVCRPALQALALEGLARGIESSTNGGDASPSIEGCRFSQCERGVELFTFQGNPDFALGDCVFEDCGIGVNLNLSIVPGPPGSLVLDRCELRRCDTGLIASAGYFDGFILVDLFDCLVADGQDGLYGFVAELGLHHCTVTRNARGLLGDAAGFTVERSIVWGNTENIVPISFLNGANFTWSDVGPTGGEGTLTDCVDIDPVFVDAVGGDFHLAGSSPLIDQGDPAQLPGGTDADFDPKVLDGNGDGIARADMGYDEHNRVHLVVSGAPVLGASLSFDLSAPAGWLYLTGVSLATADTDLGAIGSLLVAASPFFPLGMGSAPGSDSFAIPSDPILSGLVLYSQGGAVDPSGGSGSVSNRIVLAIE